MDINVVVGGASVMLLTVGITEAIKRNTQVESSVLPWITLGVALALSLAAWATTIWTAADGPVQAVITGIMVWLASMGLWSGSKSAIGN